MGFGKVVGRRHLEFKILTSYGVREPEPGTVKRLSAQPEVLAWSSVQGVGHDWESEPGKVNPDLMSAACVKKNLDESYHHRYY